MFNRSVEPLLGLLDQRSGVDRPGEVSRDVDAEEFDGIDSLYAFTVDVQRGHWMSMVPCPSGEASGLRAAPWLQGFVYHVSVKSTQHTRT